MSLILCPECGKKISSNAAQCPHCGCPASVWQKTTEITDTNTSMSSENKQLHSNQKSGSGFVVVLVAIGLIVLFGLLIAIIDRTGNDNVSSSNSKTEVIIAENFNDNSTYHQQCAKNFFINHIKEQLNDPKSFDLTDYIVQWDSVKNGYYVIIEFRARNGYGALVISRYAGYVYFSKDGQSVSFGQIKSLKIN